MAYYYEEADIGGRSQSVGGEISTGKAPREWHGGMRAGSQNERGVGL
jgi:hypothetical protein